MNILRSFLDRLPLIRAVPPAAETATRPTVRYVAESDLPPDADEQIARGTIQAWRIAPDGEQWFQVLGADADD